MSVSVYDLVNARELTAMVTAGRISVRNHPELPLQILNYTNLAQYANEWTNAERVCRGLIVTKAGEVIARGMPKFFNYGDPHGPQFLPDDIGLLTVKEDGSLGIGWAYKGHVGIATRGSFISDQAKKATSMLTPYQKELIQRAAEREETTVFEIIYPDNRIVLEYGDREENILLGWVGNKDGKMSHKFQLNNHFNTIAELLKKPIKDDAEGYVVSVLGKGMFKLKGETYLNLHKLMFGLTEKAVWEMLQSHNVYERAVYVEKFPEITKQWVLRKMQYFSSRHSVRVRLIHNITQTMYRDLALSSDEEDRKRQALWLKAKFPLELGEVFAYIDGGDEKLYPLVWKKIKPAHKPYKANQED